MAVVFAFSMSDLELQSQSQIYYMNQCKLTQEKKMFPESFHTTRDCCTNQLNLGSKTTHVHSFTTIYSVPGHCKTAGVNEDCSSLLLMKRLARLSLLGFFGSNSGKYLSTCLIP